MSFLKIQNDLVDRLDHQEMNPGKKLKDPAGGGMIGGVTFLIGKGMLTAIPALFIYACFLIRPLVIIKQSNNKDKKHP